MIVNNEVLKTIFCYKYVIAENEAESHYQLLLYDNPYFQQHTIRNRTDVINEMWASEVSELGTVGQVEAQFHFFADEIGTLRGQAAVKTRQVLILALKR